MTCNYHGSYWESPAFFAHSCYLLSVIQFPLHILGFYIVICKTPPTMRKLKLSMLVMHSTCALIDFVMAFLVIPYTVFPAAAGFAVGILTLLGVPTPVQVYLGVTSLHLISPAFVLFFEDRYNQLVRQDAESNSRRVKRAIHFGVNYLHALLAIFPIFLTTPSPEDAIAFIYAEFPCIADTLTANPNFYMATTRPSIMVACLLSVVVSMAPQTAIFYMGTLNYLRNVRTQSKRTIQMQKKLFVKISIQFFIPLGFIVATTLYIDIAAALGYVDMFLGNLSLIWLFMHGAVSTVTMLVVHKEYRTATMQLFRIRLKDAISPIIVSGPATRMSVVG